MNGPTHGRIVAVNGPLVTCEVDEEREVLQNEVAYVMCDGVPLKSEVIRIRGSHIDLQVFESTTGLKVGDDAEFSGELLTATLGPGMLGMIYDGLQNPLRELENDQGFFLRRGQYLPSLNQTKLWDFEPMARVGEQVRAGHYLGKVTEGLFPHPIMVPLVLLGTWEVKEIMPAGRYTVNDTVAILTNVDSQVGNEVNVTIKQEWPVKRPMRVYEERLLPDIQLLTQCRLIDIFFPLAEGGTACIPGPFGAGKTVLQQIISRYAETDIVIIVACGERAGEVVETIREFPRLEDPKTGKSLMDRTVIICNTSSMPVAAREASIYTGITLGEYYRQLGLKVLLLADSTSRWAQALRESSARMEEIPGEEAFPAYLESRIAAVYERAGKVRLYNDGTGSLTMIGTVSPAGGNFEEPVTQNTLKVVGAFHGLSRMRSDQRRYPAIDPLISWSLYIEQMRASLNTRHEKWVDLVQEAHAVIFKGSEIHQMMLVVGEEGIGLDDLVTYLKSEIIDAVCLQQDSFDKVDQATSRQRQISDFLLLMAMVHHAFAFASKEEAKDRMTHLQNLFFQLKYCPFGEEAYRRYRSEIEAMLDGKGASHS
ncbi:MAG TPA: V-type ATP synthase subunit A [Deltaproteobacteria bacterium]|nr:MAG: V-type sodium ATPase catalytic subunit A [Deltaproteobacteria bacterium ADurb.Bin072]HNQ85715.1 V-type ATP synthase subunit A [Deltaproteobacteria bacterium]HRW79814.1 V-type ATP synthase subunit A [Desulfomonilia bacterium]HNS90032.1 V-type ATP synthase subunit A [Deltaproteobacteria bacterium]HOC76098.1 V-type ATP synthase subunit A [Deltaproteobacteria bacterium]